jgi:ATP-binding cassette subfamily B (MDR/TAP) protein 6
MNKPNPFPPLYSASEFIWSTPFVFGPLILFSAISLFGLPRYYYNHRHQNVSSEIITTTSRPLTTFSKLIVLLSFIVTITFIADALVIISRAIIDEYWTSNVFVFYIVVSWLSWIFSLGALADETQKYSKWYWIQYLFWFIATLSDTLVGWLWLMGMIKPESGKGNLA